MPTSSGGSSPRRVSPTFQTQDRTSGVLSMLVCLYCVSICFSSPIRYLTNDLESLGDSSPLCLVYTSKE